MHDIIQHTVERSVYERQIEFGRMRMRGELAERAFAGAWSPLWRRRQPFVQIIQGVELVRQYTILDNIGVDVIMHTTLPFNFYERVPRNHRWYWDCKSLLQAGDIPVQIKSSVDGAKQFESYEPHIPIPVIILSTFLLDSTKRDIRKKTFGPILQKFPDLIPAIKAKGCQISPKILAALASIEPGMKTYWL